MRIQYSTAFKHQVKRLSRRYRHLKSDIAPIVEALQAGETPDDQLTGYGYTLYKVSAQNSDSRRGKSGGYLVIYYLKTDTHCILVTLYSKSDQADVSASALDALMVEVQRELPDL